jgi:hypothetical protein
MSAGGAVDTTTMRNSRFRTNAAKRLITTEGLQITASYDPMVLQDIVSYLGVNQQIFVYFPNGETQIIWGHIDQFTPGEQAEGAQPTATITIVASNQDDNGLEIAPVTFNGVAPAYGFTCSLKYDFSEIANSKAVLTWLKSNTPGAKYRIRAAARSASVPATTPFVYHDLAVVDTPGVTTISVTDAVWAAGSVTLTDGTAITSWAGLQIGATLSFEITAELVSGTTPNDTHTYSVKLFANTIVPLQQLPVGG